MSANPSCEVCGSTEKLMRCARCKVKIYCSRDHQKSDWREHRKECARLALTPAKAPMPAEGSSESEILSSLSEDLGPHLGFQKTSTQKVLRPARTAMPISGENVLHPKKKAGVKEGDVSLQHTTWSLYERNDLEEICRNLVHDMNEYGVCVVDNFLGEEKGKAILEEVLFMYKTQGIFKDGQLVSSKGGNDLKTIRGDRITWITGNEFYCENIKKLINRVDAVVVGANRLANNGKLGKYKIDSRTKAMVACYPGHGSHYVKHVDNPNRDGRCITAIYYLNLNWNVKQSGGLLRIFPEGWLGDKVADIEPVFDRVLFFWSDRRNPHEVQPAYDTRYAITLWYFDASERKEARERYEGVVGVS